ncbi:MAG: hypothetical protein ACE5I4_06615 [Thermoplasmata archaeon]
MASVRLPTYIRREEALRGRGLRILAIVSSGVRRELKRRWTLLALIAAILFGVISTIFNIFLAPLIQPGVVIDASFFFDTLTFPIVLFFILVVAAAVGSGLISDDMRHMSLTLYLSRPLTTGDYLAAKALIVGIFVFIAVAVPAIASPIVAAVLLYVGWELALQVLLAGAAFGLLTMVLFSLLALLFSSLTQRKGVAAAGTIASVLALEILSVPLFGVFESLEVFHLSLYQNLLAVGRVLYGLPASGITAFGFLAWEVSLPILVALIAVFTTVAYTRIRSMEVITG